MRLKNAIIALAVVCVAAFARAGDNLDLGAPGAADRIVDREGYALGYDAELKIPRWVAYRLTADEVTDQKTGRINDFAPDPDIPEGPQLEDYRGSGYDRGHMAPAADMKWSRNAMKECFYLSNMCPQDHANNSDIWNDIENTVRGFACSEGAVWVVTGPVTSKPPKKTIGKGRVAVPDGFYKVVYSETPPGKMIGFMVDNAPISGKAKHCAVAVSDIEKATGLVFFPELADGAALKSSFDASAWDWSKSQKPRNRESPDTGYWLSTNSNKRHNSKCENYRRTRGRPCGKDEGVACKRCGG
ncbi:MAG: DNA/RNA non-specific endonuclease [Kiritimatiellae bacterium]|nr:DNA/RNA non-specific endonuclease [Kiritimatiellia bacterium]